jgi:hypothetical protein
MFHEMRQSQQDHVASVVKSALTNSAAGVSVL